jgi:hypothetical protein
MMPDVTTPPEAPVVADDAIRKQVAWEVIASDAITCIVVLVALFKYGSLLSKDILPIAATIIGSIVGYRARDTGTVIGYLFGSSSGSTAKSAAYEKGPATAPTVAVTPQPNATTTTTTTTEPKVVVPVPRP